MIYRVVEDFEAALCEYTGARFAVTTNSCSMALFLSLKYCFAHGHGYLLGTDNGKPFVQIPKRTYCSVPMAIIHAGAFPLLSDSVDSDWRGAYPLRPLPVWDSARRFTSGMYRPGQFQCVSFQTSKILGLEQGGAILHDSPEADEWLRRARFDGRLNASEKMPQQVGWHCYMNPSTAALGLQRLACLPRDNPDQCGSEAFEDLSGLGIW